MPLATRRDIGQLLIGSFKGTSVPVEWRSLARDFDLGGAILFGRNIEAPEQVAELAVDIEALGRAMPTWVSIDQEGGRVARLKEPFTRWPPMATLGRAGSEKLAERFARAESAAFVTGNGVDKPKGFLTHTAVPNATWTWGNLGYIPTGAAGAMASIDPLVDLVYALPAQYRARASFVMNSRTTGVLRKLKDADGRFLWSDGLTAGEPARLMGYKVLICEDMPDIAANAMAIAFGDFQSGYTVAERPDLRVLRDPYSAKPYVLFYTTKRVGGGVQDYDAIKLLKFA